MQTMSSASEMNVDLDLDLDRDTGSSTDLRLLCRKGKTGNKLWIVWRRSERGPETRCEFLVEGGMISWAQSHHEVFRLGEMEGDLGRR